MKKCPKCGKISEETPANKCFYCFTDLGGDESKVNQDSNKKFCNQCGAKVDINSKFCTSCGKQLSGIVRNTSYSGDKPYIPNYLVQAILCVLFCCLPAGIVALVFASQVNSKVAAGDIDGAYESSNKAKLWCWWSFGIGLTVILIYVIILAVVGPEKVLRALRRGW